MEHSNQSAYYLQQAYSSLSQNKQISIFNTAALANASYVDPQTIEHLVELEMNRIQENCLCKEAQYVEQMLMDNPITIERRPNNNYQQEPNSEDEVDVVTVTSTVKKDTNKFLQHQRAEACRRSRYNNKIKKAKIKYRHKYMSQKLLQSTHMFDCIHELIAEAENLLLSQGLTKDKLEHLRQSFGVETAIESVQGLKEKMKMEN